MTEDAAPDVPDVELKDAVTLIAENISVLTTGEHALLRRMYLTKKPAAEGAVVKVLVYARMKPHEYEPDYPAWRLLVHVAALLSGTGRARSHHPNRSLGTAMHVAGLSENRLLRITAARGDALQEQIVLTTRMLVQRNAGPVNLWTLLHLVGRDSDKVEAARIRIAQDYFAAVARSQGDPK